jgi:uncharacterized protein
MELAVFDVPQRARYEVHADGALAGYAEYRRTDRGLVFTHTEIEPRYEGQGVGSGLVHGALDDVRQRQLAVEVRCPFVRAWIDRHPAYAGLERTVER